MASNRLKFNPPKTELIWLGSSRRLKHCPMDALNIAGVSIKPSSYVRISGCTSTVIYLWRLTSLISPARAFITFVSYVLFPESHHGLSSLAYQSTCSQSGRLLQRSSGWPATDTNQQASIHSPCSSSPCAAATRLGQCLCYENRETT